MYRIDFDNVKKRKKYIWKLLLEALLFLICAIVLIYIDSEREIHPVVLISIVFVLWNIGNVFYEIIKVKKRLKQLEYLSKYGTLIKGLSFKMKKTKYYINGDKNKKYLYAISVKYESNNKVLNLVGDPRYDMKFKDEDGSADLLIDPSDPKNYYLDFNIEKI